MINSKRSITVIIIGFLLFLPSGAFLIGSLFSSNTPEVGLPSAAAGNSSRSSLLPGEVLGKNISASAANSNNLVEARETELHSVCPERSGIQQTTNGNDLLAIVDKNHQLPVEFAPDDLVWIKDYHPPYITYGRIRKLIIGNLIKMLIDMKNAGLEVEISSAFRDYPSQQRVFNNWVQKVGVSKAQFYAAGPGFSEHQLGTALDINPSSAGDKKTKYAREKKVYNWLQTYAYKYGFVSSYPLATEEITGYSYEPWHYRFVGIKTASQIHGQALTLTEYLYRYNGICL